MIADPAGIEIPENSAPRISGDSDIPRRSVEMNNKEKTKADCYSAGDRKVMELTQRIRAKLFFPLLETLVKTGATADMVTVLSFVSGLLFCPLFFYSKALALGSLGLHVFFDGLDGPLARHTGKASRKGSFTDTTTDQIVIFASTLTLIYAGIIGTLPGVIYIFVYTVVIAFSMIRNALAIPYSWLVRPRLLIYFWFIVELYILPGTIDFVLWIVVILLAAKMITGFVKIRKSI